MAAELPLSKLTVLFTFYYSCITHVYDYVSLAAVMRPEKPWRSVMMRYELFGSKLRILSLVSRKVH